MSFHPANATERHQMRLPYLKKEYPEDRGELNAKGQLVAIVQEYRVRFLSFMQHCATEVMVEVAHNILQTEEPFIDQLEEIRIRLDSNTNFFNGHLLSLPIGNQEPAYSFDVINLIMANHFNIPFHRNSYCQLINNVDIHSVNFPFYVVTTKISYYDVTNPLPEQIREHMFCIRSFISNDGSRTWVVIDSTYHRWHRIVPFSLGNDLDWFLFGSYGEEEFRCVNRHLRRLLPWVSDEPNDVRVFGFFPNELQKLDNSIHQDAIRQRDGEIDAILDRMEPFDRSRHLREIPAVQDHYLDEISMWF